MNYILREIGAVSRCIHYINDLKFKEIHLQKGQFIFLTRICENPGINHVDLSNLLKVDKTTTTKVVQKFIKAGYIDKKRDMNDKRMWRLYPKEKALEIYPLIIKEENNRVEICFDNFTEEEKELAYQLVKKMRKNIENHWKEIKKTRGVNYDKTCS
ncbi:MarR family winged helix-turn-helix transcriptional regulator [Clostridium tyrobutyricum]|uniref:MarR family winged helix-turn-helix transcriptional regulator n=1 Tax=Clostridium tyrobutyricum TaxID=1519 RepID=UPI002B20DF40|nr:MarR family transcriptional regulator [Clostridium tyrobutyricum]MEA5007831.1 MarR family transcriptional regulator [Clostridium tyrobutyricum]